MPPNAMASGHYCLQPSPPAKLEDNQWEELLPTLLSCSLHIGVQDQLLGALGMVALDPCQKDTQLLNCNSIQSLSRALFPTTNKGS